MSDPRTIESAHHYTMAASTNTIALRTANTSSCILLFQNENDVTISRWWLLVLVLVRGSVTLGGGLRPSEVGQGLVVALRANRISSVRWSSSGGLLHNWMARVPCIVWDSCTITIIKLKVARWSLISVRPAPYRGLVYHWMLGWVRA